MRDPHLVREIVTQFLPGDSGDIDDPFNQGIQSAKRALVDIPEHASDGSIASKIWQELVIGNQGLTTGQKKQLEILAIALAQLLQLDKREIAQLYRKAGLTPPYTF